jgi:hypothetical protein
MSSLKGTSKSLEKKCVSHVPEPLSTPRLLITKRSMKYKERFASHEYIPDIAVCKCCPGAIHIYSPADSSNTYERIFANTSGWHVEQ